MTEEVAQKVKDSLSCIIGGCRNSTNNLETWQIIERSLVNETIIVILWLEEDTIIQKYKNKSIDYQKKLQGKLKWLTNLSKNKGLSNNVRVYSSANYDNNLDLIVKNIST